MSDATQGKVSEQGSGAYFAEHLRDYEIGRAHV